MRGVVKFFNGTGWTYIEGEVVENLPQQGQIWTRLPMGGWGDSNLTKVEIARNPWHRSGGDARITYFQLDENGNRTSRLWYKYADGTYAPEPVEASLAEFLEQWRRYEV